MQAKINKVLPSSFRDPSGFLFYRNGRLYRQINSVYSEKYDHLISSGLYKTLIREQLLILHKEVGIKPYTKGAYKVIQPEVVPFVSYPYEWSFSQLKDAALTVLKVQELALQYGISLKDSSAYNVQFVKGRPILIDTLSFEIYKEGEPWVAYRQFCQHFLSPLVLMSYTDVRLNLLLRDFIDGVPLDLASKILPWKARLNLFLLTHIYLHAASQNRFSDRRPASKKTFKLGQMQGLVDNLKTGIENLEWFPSGTEWADYYKITNYSRRAFSHKKGLVKSFLRKTKPKLVWDLGANVGTFSRLASEQGVLTIAFDIDPAAVEKNYLEVKEKREQNILPLLIDLSNPSPSLGWAHEERDSLLTRGKADTIMALALIHHLCISNNLPFRRVASFLAKSCEHLIIEFVPKEDSQVKRLLSTRRDIFENYNQEQFEKVFSSKFRILQREPIKESKRILYLMGKK